MESQLPKNQVDTSKGKTSILIVDDRLDKLLAMRTVLEGLDQDLVCVRSGNEALRELLKQDFAVILLDVNMPEMDGFETATLIRKRQRSETTPIIFVSAVNDAETHVSLGYSLGAVDYILTPIVPEILRAKVAVFVDLFRKTEKVKRQAQENARLIQEQAARVEAEAARERLAFLAEAGSELAGSLDYEQIFESLNRLIVPNFADYCFIDQVDEIGRLRRVADSRKAGMVGHLRANANCDASDIPSLVSERVLASKKPELRNQSYVPLIGEGSGPESSEHQGFGEEFHYLAIPLSTRGSVIGVVFMVRTDKHHPFSAAQLSLAEELALRVALALENASLYSAAHRAREEAEAANKAKDRFLAVLSHELRTPLTPVITSIVNLEGDENLSEETRQTLLVMRRNVELEARLIDDLLDLTRVGSGKVSLSWETVNVHCLLKNALEICRPDIEAKELSLVTEFDQNEIFVAGDPARLQQMFWNIIRNATKFTSEGTIQVSTSSKDKMFQVEVSDTGMGIEPELLDRIFLPFEQSESGLFGGLGLGLTITKALVDLHNGHIHVKSNGKDQGATFILQFPIADAPAASLLTSQATPATDEMLPLRILIVEDHADTNEALQLLLTMRGYHVLSALNVKSALALAETNVIDVLISDLGLPDGNAGQTMELVESLYGATGIALSGYGMEEDKERSRKFGFSHHLVKPVEVTRLDSILSDLSHRAGSMRSLAESELTSPVQ
ncbi:MAG: response regulator [Verrucomicrobiota bacterium]